MLNRAHVVCKWVPPRDLDGAVRQAQFEGFARRRELKGAVHRERRAGRDELPAIIEQAALEIDGGDALARRGHSLGAVATDGDEARGE